MLRDILKLDDYSFDEKKISVRYRQYKNGAKVRGILFKLTYIEFRSFWNSNCEYCGDKINGIGIDRIDSNEDYELDNVVSCCKICNRMKSNHDVVFFVNHCTKIFRTLHNF